MDAVADRNCSIPLHYAARANLIDMAELLLENGSNARTVNAKGFTALHFALTFGHVAMAELLLRPKYSADVNIHSGVVEHRSRVRTKHDCTWDVAAGLRSARPLQAQLEPFSH